jgi:hypothetical protein
VQSILTDEEGNNGLQNNALKLLGKNNFKFDYYNFINNLLLEFEFCSLP